MRLWPTATGKRNSAGQQLALIAAGYALAFVGGLAAAAVNELRMSADVAQGSPGMVAFGDVVLFILVTGLLGLAPTWFLLRLWLAKSSRTLVAAELLAAAVGPASWLAVIWLATSPRSAGPPSAGLQVLGLLVAFVALPRIVLGPVLMVIEAATFLLVRAGRARALLIAAALMDLIPLGLFALHMAGAIRR
jgi:hypothetical protein